MVGHRVDHADRRRAEIERALARLLDRAAVHDRVGERDADLDRVGARVDDRAHDVAPLAAEPAGDVRDEQLARRASRAARAGAPRGSLRARPSISATCAASLSPRPDSVTSTVEPAGIERPASRASQPIACAGSSAGTMPSVADSSWKPASASSSVAAWYSARPVRREHRVLGTDTRIVEAGADRRRLEHLAVLVLQEQRAHAVHDARHAAADRRAVMTRLEPEPAGLDADERARRCRRTRRTCPIAFEPPPTHATTTSGSAPSSSSRHCRRASSPTTRWNSRTIHGNGCGPIAEPRQ